jgi:acetyl esterase/lipase
MKTLFALTLSIIVFNLSVLNAQTIPLYSGAIANSKPVADEEKTEQNGSMIIVSKITVPSLTVFQPEASKANGTAVIICPGGGYWINAIGHEGFDVAKVFNQMGVTAFVLKYRIPNDQAMTNRETGPLQDVQQAIRVVREGAAKYKINPARIGVMGFSAGGHLASTAGTHYDSKQIETSTSLRPDFLMLIYPVISFSDSVGHLGSREQLIGKTPSEEKIKLYSNELQITANTPPTFLVHATDDDVVNVANSVLFYENLVRHKVPAELHIYQQGGHGFGMNNPRSPDKWMDRLKNWMEWNGWLKK